ncbi:Fructan 1-exohydrolase [Hordeum vulgare]|nr:Fructan 1-exohydrolase [Hordeum vulgare]
MYFNGIYHEFYEYNLNGPIFGDIVWGHSVSTDLLKWIGLESALVRDTPSDIDGCWTGSVTILPGGKPVIIYTGGNIDQHQTQNIVFPKNRSDPYLREWIKAANNPVLRLDEPGMNVIEFTDPTSGWIGPDGHWRMAIGGELNGYSAALLYKSEDFLNWTKVDHPLYSHNVRCGVCVICDVLQPTVANLRGREGEGQKKERVLVLEREWQPAMACSG